MASSLNVHGTTYKVNDRGVIDVTNRYNTAQYMRGGESGWLINSPMPLVAGIMVHHWAGWFGTPLTALASPHKELYRLDLLADFHSTTWGIGPGYNLVAFPSGRVWAVGKHGTHRAHTKGRNPVHPRLRWNVVGRSIVAAGNWQDEEPPIALINALRLGVEEIRSWPQVSSEAVVYGHRDVPTVNFSGVRFSQGTLCPGEKMMPHIDYIAGSAPALLEPNLQAALSQLSVARINLNDIGERLQTAHIAVDKAEEELRNPGGQS